MNSIDLLSNSSSNAGSASPEYLPSLRDGIYPVIVDREEFGRDVDAWLSALSSGEAENVTVFLLRLQGFRPLGESAGNALLRTVAPLVKSVIGQDATLARMSTDEFAIVKSVSCLSEIAELAATIVGVVQSTYLVDGRVIYLGANVGMAFAPEQACTSEGLLRRADLALQRSQQVGDGTVCFYSPEMDEEAKQWSEIQRDLQSALMMLRWEWMRKPHQGAAAGMGRSPEDQHGVNQALLNRSRRNAAARKVRAGHGASRRCANRKSS